MFRIAFIPGWGLLLGIGLVSLYISSLVVVGGKHPLEASALAVLLGLAVRNFFGIPARAQGGTKASENLLIFGIVLMGASLNLGEVAAQGLGILAVIVVTMAVGLLAVILLAKFFSLSQGLGLLLAVGTTICGGTAVAVTAPLIKAREEETSYAVATVALWGLVAILLYPEVAKLAGVSEFTFGVFAGTSIHSTPQVVGAGFIFSDLAGRTATAVKLVRNCFMAPLALIIALWFARRERRASGSAAHIDVSRAFPWFLFGYFIVAAMSYAGFFTKAGTDAFTETGKFLILLGMAGVGCNTDLGAFRSVGYKPLVVGLIGSIIVAIASSAMIAVAL